MGEKNVYQRLACVTSEVKKVLKSLNVETAKGKGYKAVSETDIIDAVKPLEEKHGIYSYPLTREIVESHILESESEYNGKVTKRVTYFSRMKTVYRFVNTDKPTDFVDMVVFSDGIDSSDKGCGKAMTYADKYALMKAYKIRTGNDPDGRSMPDKPGYVDPDPEDTPVKCEWCSTALMDHWDGRVLVKADRLGKRCKDLHDHIFCDSCRSIFEKRNRDKAFAKDGDR